MRISENLQNNVDSNIVLDDTSTMFPIFANFSADRGAIVSLNPVYKIYNANFKVYILLTKLFALLLDIIDPRILSIKNNSLKTLIFFFAL